MVLHPRLGHGVAVLVALPVMTSAWLCGLPGAC